jgi:hypothetical protein
MSTGWIKAHRSLLNSSIWNSIKPEHTKVAIACMLLANHSPFKWVYKNEAQECMPGQFKTSYQQLAHHAGKGVTIEVARQALRNLKALEFLTVVSTKTGLIITVVNWAHYQSVDDNLPKENHTPFPKDTQTKPKRFPTNKNENKDKQLKEDRHFKKLKGNKRLINRYDHTIIITSDYEYDSKGNYGTPGYRSKKNPEDVYPAEHFDPA